MNYSTNDIMAQVAQARLRLAQQKEQELTSCNFDVFAQKEQELTSCNFDVFAQKEQEVYKDKNIERYNYTSRNQDCEEEMGMTSSPFGEIPEEVTGEGLVSSAAPNLITGITVQHCRTEQGIKVTCNIQTLQDSYTGSIVALTAELKRSNRMNQVRKIYQPDSYPFQELYTQAIADIRSLPVRDRKNICIGRLHQRGQRSAWVADMMMIGYMKTEKIYRVYVNVNNQEFDIELTDILSPQQQKLYHAGGTYGELKTGKTAPTLSTLKRVKI